MAVAQKVVRADFSEDAKVELETKILELVRVAMREERERKVREDFTNHHNIFCFSIQK